jgi:DNA-binding CsgD family transcriptional regulator
LTVDERRPVDAGVDARAAVEGVALVAVRSAAVPAICAGPAAARVGAGAASEHVVAPAAPQDVRAAAAPDRIGAAAAPDHVVATAAADEVITAPGDHRARPRRIAATGVDALTASELRIVRLAAAGRTNLEIAQELWLTPKTVETHLTHAYGKLELAGRGSRQRLSEMLTDEPPAA